MTARKRLACLCLLSALVGCSAPVAEKSLSEACSERYCGEITHNEGGGAATSAYSSVYVSDTKGRDRKLVLEIADTDGLALTWANTTTLEVGYKGGSIRSFTNEWRSSVGAPVVNGDVEIVLKRLP